MELLFFAHKHTPAHIPIAPGGTPSLGTVPRYVFLLGSGYCRGVFSRHRLISPARKFTLCGNLALEDYLGVRQTMPARFPYVPLKHTAAPAGERLEKITGWMMGGCCCMFKTCRVIC